MPVPTTLHMHDKVNVDTTLATSVFTIDEKYNPSPGEREMYSNQLFNYIAAFDGEQFHVLKAIRDARNECFVVHDDQVRFYAARLYYPVDPTMTHEDIEGAHFAEPNATNDGWIFKHTKPEYHHEQEFLAEGLSLALIQPYMNSVLGDAIGETGPLQVAAIGKWKAWHAFSNAVQAEVRKQIQKLLRGHFHKDVHHDHLRTVVHRAVHTVFRAWAADEDPARKRQYQVIHTQANALMQHLGKSFDVQTRAEKVAADAAEEAKKKAAEAEAPADPPADPPAGDGAS